MASLNKIKDEELINILQEIFNDNWKLKILYSLYNKNKRFKELREHINTSEKTLVLKLKELEDKQLIKREYFHEMPPRVEYSLSKHTISLKPILKNLIEWCDSYTKGVIKIND